MSFNSSRIQQLVSTDLDLMGSMMKTFGEAFNEPETYCSAQPGSDYLKRLLGMDYFIALAALKDEQIVAGIDAKELHIFEQER